MGEVVTKHTAQLSGGEHAEIRALLEAAFAGDFAETDHEHTLGGMHALVRVDGRLVGHGAVVQRRLLHGGRVLRTGYVEAVAVDAAHRRQGHGDAVMGALEAIIRGAYELGALSASADGAPLYTARGWRHWGGPTSVLSPRGIERTAGDDATIHVLPVSAPLDRRLELTCDWRAGDVW